MKKYVFSLIITAVIFTTAFLASNYFNQKRIAELRSIQDRISIDLMSSETQFDLLEDLKCEDLGNTALTKELNSIAERLSFMEESRGVDDPEVVTLKEYYSLLQIKDFLLMRRITDKCRAFKPISILYFYSNQGDCPDCVKTGYVLTRLRQDYPELRIYSFDYNLGLGALNTLIALQNIDKTLPALYMNGKVYYGFQSLEDIQKIIPELKTLATSSPATSTPTTTTTRPGAARPRSTTQ